MVEKIQQELIDYGIDKKAVEFILSDCVRSLAPVDVVLQEHFPLRENRLQVVQLLTAFRNQKWQLRS